jgi:nitroreductase
MRRPAWLALSLALAACSQPIAEQRERRSNETLSTIHGRRSVRAFTGAPVERSQLEQIVRAGMAAPSAINKQPWAFVVVTDRAQLDALNAGLPSAKMLEKAGAAIVVCALPAEAARQSRDFAVIDTSAASQNILLAVESLGLGAVWTAAFPDEERMRVVRQTLGIPEEVLPLNVIPIGHPTGAEKPKDKYRADRIHWDRW